MQSAGVPLEEKARVAPGTTHGVAETALSIEMECDVLSIERSGTVRATRRAGRAARLAPCLCRGRRHVLRSSSRALRRVVQFLELLFEAYNAGGSRG